MAMFGGPKRTVFKPSVYETSRRPRRMPRWVVLLLFGVVLGAGGLLFLQTSYGPKRLTVLESQQLASELNGVTLERQRLNSQLEETRHELETERAQRQRLESELAQARAALEPLQREVELFADAMPADPRGGPLGISAASFANREGGLAYHVLLMRDPPWEDTYQGIVQFTVEGRYASGRTQTVTLDPLPVSMQRYEHLRGSVALPEGFSARRVTVRVFDPDGKRQRAMRILIARG